jgi:hypothetical protein
MCESKALAQVGSSPAFSVQTANFKIEDSIYMWLNIGLLPVILALDLFCHDFCFFQAKIHAKTILPTS